MILVAYRHGLRVSELCALRWDQVDFEHGLLHVRRIKNGLPSVHPLGGGELRALRKLQREATPSRHVFTTERRAPMSPAGFRKMLARTGEVAAFPFPVHPHMLRHACGSKLADDGQDTRAVQHYLGRKNIQHTVRYNYACNYTLMPPVLSPRGSASRNIGSKKFNSVPQMGDADQSRPHVDELTVWKCHPATKAKSHIGGC
jgi:type 1 fimbriae regulatory protein FimB/type 1 fimbriae regulatory protein FimE